MTLLLNKICPCAGKGIPLLSLFVTLVFYQSSMASPPATIESILQEKEEPAGVIIEIVTGKSDGLDWALPKAQDYIKRLKKHFPDMPVAIVTHGRELFALAKDKQDSNKAIHSLTQALQKDDVKLHVCGTYAGWKGLTEEDFPDYVDVSATGSAQINDYIAVGFLHIIIK